MGLNCFPGEGSAKYPLSKNCLVDHAEREVPFHLSVTIYSPYGIADNESGDGSEQEAVSDGSGFDIGGTIVVPVAERVDATMTGPGQTFARRALVDAVPKLIKQLQTPSDPPPVWSIQERPSPHHMSRRLNETYSYQRMSKDSDERYTISHLRDTRSASSVERMVLCNTNLVGRIPVIIQDDETSP